MRFMQTNECLMKVGPMYCNYNKSAKFGEVAKNQNVGCSTD